MTKLTSKELLKKQAQEIDFDAITRQIVDDYIDFLDEDDCSEAINRKNEAIGALKKILTSDAHIEYFRSFTSKMCDIPSYDVYERKGNNAYICKYTKDIKGWWGKKNKIHIKKEAVKDCDNYEKQLFNLFRLFYPTMEEDNSRKQYKKCFVLKLKDKRRFILKKQNLLSLWYRYFSKSKYKTTEDQCKEEEKIIERYAKKSPLNKEIIRLLKSIYKNCTLDDLEQITMIIAELRNDTDRQKMLDKIKSGEKDMDELQDFAEKLGCPSTYYKHTIPHRKKKGRQDDLDKDLAEYTSTPKAKELRAMLEPIRVKNKKEWLCGILGSLDTDELRYKMIEELNTYDMSYKEIYYVAGQIAGDCYGYEIFKDFD